VQFFAGGKILSTGKENGPFNDGGLEKGDMKVNIVM
jgi:hypothetical protein